PFVSSFGCQGRRQDVNSGFFMQAHLILPARPSMRNLEIRSSNVNQRALKIVLELLIAQVVYSDKFRPVPVSNDARELTKRPFADVRECKTIHSRHGYCRSSPACSPARPSIGSNC